MQLFFAWINEEECFDPDLHCRMDEDIFSLEIREEEHHFPKALLVIRNPRCGFLHPSRKQWAYLSVEHEGKKKLLFKGALQVLPLGIDGETIEIELVAEPNDSEDRQKKLLKHLRKKPYWDHLFIKEGEEEDPVEILDGRSGFLTWSRTSHDVAFTDLFKGRHLIDLGRNHFRDAFQIKLSELPLSAVHVKVSAAWVQKAEGLADLSYALRHQFQDGLINSLTGPGLVQKWWQEGERIGRSGYRVESAWIKEIKPPSTGALNLYPSVSDPILVSPFDPRLGRGKEARKIRLKRYWYKAGLVLGWTLKNRRREEIEFTLRHETQLPPTLLQKSRTIHLRLQRITEAEPLQAWRPHVRYKKGSIVLSNGERYRALQNHLSSQMFETDLSKWQALNDGTRIPLEVQRGSILRTDRGHGALLHALEVAKSHLAASARAVELEVTAPFDACLEISCDHSLSLEDDRLPQRRVTGKVTSYRLIVDGGTGKCFAKIKVGLSVGTGKIQEVEDACLETYCSADFCDLGETQKWRAPCGVSFSSYHSRGEDDPYLCPYLWKSEDVIEEIIVSNPPARQNRILKQNQYPFGHHVTEALKEAETEIQIRLKNLKSPTTLDRRMTLEIDQAWSAPQQIDLSAVQ